jgi:alpha-tubulin suppressor-like RCC1 family protein
MNALLCCIFATFFLLAAPGLAAWNVGSGVSFFPIAASSSGGFLLTVDNAFSTADFNQVEQSGQVQCAFSKTEKYELLILGAVVLMPAMWLRPNNRLVCIAPTSLAVGNLYVAIYFDGQAKDLGRSISIYSFIYAYPLSAPLAAAEERSTTIRFSLYMYPRTSTQGMSCLFSIYSDTTISNYPYMVWPIVGPSAAIYSLTIYAPPGHPWLPVLSAPICVFTGRNYQSGGVSANQNVLARTIQCPVPIDAPSDFEVTFKDQLNPTTFYTLGTTTGVVLARKSVLLVSVASILSADTSSTDFVCNIPTISQPQPVFFEYAPTATLQLTYSQASTGQKYIQYYSAPSVTGLSNYIGHFSGGLRITISGTNFMYLLGMSCRFQDTVTSAVYLSATQIVCISPFFCPRMDDSTAVLGHDWRKCINFNTELMTLCKDSYASCSDLSRPVPFINVSVGLHFSGNGINYANTGLKFVYIPEPKILSLLPNRGPVEGGITVTILGYGFPSLGNTPFNGQVFCKFFSALSFPGILVDSTTMLCTCPASSLNPAGSGFFETELSISFNSETYIDAPSGFKYFSVASISPSLGPSVGKTAVNIKGVNTFLSPSDVERYTPKCRFSNSVLGEFFVSISFGSDQSVTCLSPAVPEPLRFNVSILLISGQTSSIFFEYQYAIEAVVFRLLPRFGPKNGGYFVFVSGANFVANPLLSCRFRSSDSETITDLISGGVVFINSSALLCKVPPAAIAKDSTLDVSPNRQQFSSTSLVFSYFALKKFSPIGGIVSGGTILKVHVENISPTQAYCKFGQGYSQTLLRDENNNSMTFPASSGISNGFQFSMVANTSNVIQFSCTTTAQLSAFEQVPFSISYDGINFAAGEESTFYFYNDPQIKVLSTNVVPIQGKTPITITGQPYPRTTTGLGTNLIITCKWGGLGVSVAKYIKSDSILCFSPPASDNLVSWVTGSNNGSSKTYVNLTISFNEADYNSIPYSVLYYNNDLVLPSLVDHLGGTIVYLTGVNYNLAAGTEVGCLFWLDIYVTGIFDELTSTIECEVPPQPPDLGSDFLPVRSSLIANVANQYSHTRLVVTYFRKPVLSLSFPTFGTRYAPSHVVILGTGFFNDPNMRCRFGRSPFEKASDFKFLGLNKAPTNPSQRVISEMFTVAKFLNISAIACNTSMQTSVSKQDIFLTYNFQQYSVSKDAFFFYGITSIFPRAASVVGGSIISVFGNFFLSNPKYMDATVAFPDKPAILCIWRRLNGSSYETYFESSAMTTFRLNTNIQCILPPSKGSLKEVVYLDVSISAGIDSTFDQNILSYFDEANVSSTSPSIGFLPGGTVIIVSGYGFVQSPDLSCIFSISNQRDITIDATYQSPVMLKCVTPKFPIVGEWKLDISLNKVTNVPNTARAFQVYAIPFALKFYPFSIPRNSTSKLSMLLSLSNVPIGSIPSIKYFNNIIPATVTAESSSIGMILSLNATIPSDPILNEGRVPISFSLDGASTFFTTSFEIHVYKLSSFLPIVSMISTRTFFEGEGIFLSQERHARVLFVQLNGTYTFNYSVPLTCNNFTMICTFNGTVSFIPIEKVGDYSIFIAPESQTSTFLMTTESFSLKVIPDILLSSLSPRYGVSNQDFVITMVGTNFPGLASFVPLCQLVGHQSILTSILSANGAVYGFSCSFAAIPDSIGTFPVLFSINSRDFVYSGFSFVLYVSPFITHLIPQMVPMHTSIPITIVGFNFRNDLEQPKVLIGGAIQVVQFVNSTAMVMNSPVTAFAAGFPLRITIDNNLFSNSITLNLMSLTRISPSLGSIYGRTNVCAVLEPSVVSSSGSWVSPSCRFSSYKQNVSSIVVSGFLSASCGGIVCQTPAASAMNSSSGDKIYVEASLSHHKFAITTKSVQMASAENPLNLIPFLYLLDPIVERIFPSFVSATGGTTISVWGSNFFLNGLLSCQFHPDIFEQIPAEFTNTSFLTCSFPTICFAGTRMLGCLSKKRLALNASFLVKVSVNNQEWGSVGASILPHTIFNFDPNGGLRQGGTVVNISGINLNHGYDYSCRFKTIIVPAILHLLSGTVSCTSPQYSDADETLELCLFPRSVCFINAANPVNQHYFTNEKVIFKYYSSAPLLSFKPDSSSPNGNLDIRISLIETASLNLFSSYSQSARVSCRFGSVIVVGQLVNSKLIICKAPENQPGASYLDISLNDQQFSQSFASFFYFRPERTEPFGAVFEPCVEASSQGLRCFFTLGYSLKSVFPFQQDSSMKSYGINVQIYGKGFSFSENSIAPNAVASQPRCLFGDYSDGGKFQTIVLGSFQADQSIICRSPGLLRSNVSMVPVAINLNGIDGIKSSRFPLGDQWATAESSPTGWRSSAGLVIISSVLTSLSPSIETANGGWMTTLRGENFVNNGGIERCRFIFAGIPTPTIVPAMVTSSTTMVCQVAAIPFIARGSVNEAIIEFSFNGVQFVQCSRCSASGVSKVLYLSISYIIPSISPIQVSALVTLTGINFEQTVCLCSICICPPGVTGLAQAFPSSYLASLGNFSTSIDVKVQANNKDVVLIMNLFSSGAKEGLYTVRTSFGQVDVVIGNIYLYTDITFTAYYPRSGPEDGSTVVTIFGTNILNRPELQCYFGNTYVAATFIDGNTVSCVSPPIVTSTATSVAIGLAVLDSQCPPGSTTALVCPARFSKFECFKAPSLCFPGKYTCSLASSRNFGQAEVSGPLTCSVPGTQFLYWKVPRILAVTPPSGPSGGFTQIIVTETEAFSRVKDEPFMSSLDPYCAIGSDLVRGVFEQVSGIIQLKCLTEAGLTVGSQFLTISLNNQQFTSPQKIFVVHSDLKFMQIIPSRIFVGSISPITIVGQNFQRSDSALNLVVKQDSLPSQPALYLSPVTAIVQQFNAGSTVRSISLMLSLNNENFVGPAVIEVISSTSTPCPLNCNGLEHGKCIPPQCVCNQPYSGVDCSYTYGITSMVPCSGPQVGGTSVTIRGYRFDKAAFSENQNIFESGLNVMCRFGTVIVPANVTLSGQVTCFSPPLFKNGSVAVDVTLFGDSFWTTNGAFFPFHYYMEPSLFSVEPSVIPESGGSILVIKSAHNHSFMAAPRDSPKCLMDPPCKHLLMQQHVGLGCLFNDHMPLKSPSINYNSISELRCSTPSFDIGTAVSQATIPLFITLNGQQVSMNSLELLIYKDPEVHSISPEVGSWSSSVAVTLRGKGFFQSKLKQCAFEGRISQSFQILSSTTAICYSTTYSLLPPYLVKNAFMPAQISFSMNGKTFSSINSSFSFIRNWKITSFNPSLGPESGNTRVIISGIDIMYTKSLQCKFGSLMSPEPPCCLTGGSGGSCSTTFGITCSLLLCLSPPNPIPRPTFSTKTGFCEGNRLYGLTRDLCLPTDYSCSFQVLDPTTKSMLCKSNRGSASIVGADGEIVPPAFIPSVDEILHPDIPLRVGSLLHLSLDGQNNEAMDSPFIYHETVNITALIPDIAPATKSSVITVVGDGFQKVDTGGNKTASMLLCKFGAFKYIDNSGNEADAVGEYIDTHTILCRTSSTVTLKDTSGNVLTQQDASVEISLNGNQYSNSQVKINFVLLWSITSINPEVGSITGGMLVTLTGPYFRVTSVMKCLFGSQSSTFISVLSQTVVICRAPSYITCGDTNVSLTLDGSTYSAIIPKTQGVPNFHTIFRFQGVPFMELFGNNDFGQLGYGDKLLRSSPQQNQFFENLKISQIAMGQAHTLVISGITYGDQLGTVPKEGVLYSMGTNFVGQLGVGDNLERLTPAIVPCNGARCYLNVSGSENSFFVNPFWTRKISFVACGGFHSFAIADDNSVWAWGWNNKGQLGFGVGYLEPFSLYPLAVPFFADNILYFNVIRLAAGFTHSVAVSSLGQVYAWGDNRKGQLGLGDFNDRSLPSLVSSFASDKESPVWIVDVACGSYFSAAISRIGEIHVWGSNRKGQLGSCASAVTGQAVGSPTCKPIPTQVEAETVQVPYPVKVILLSGRKATSLSTGSSFVIVTLDNGDIYLWGENSFGQLSMCDRSAVGCIAAYGDTSYKRIPTLGRVPFYTIGGQCTNLNFQNCLDASTYLVKQRFILTSAAGAEHSVFIFQDTEPIGKGGQQLSRRFISASGRNHFGQLGIGSSAELSGLAISQTKRLTNLMNVSAAYHQSSYIMSCPIDSVTKTFCSNNGICSQLGLCNCDKGFRGFDCSFQCAGGAVRPCSLNGDENEARQVYPIIRQQLSTMYGLDINQLLSDLIARLPLLNGFYSKSHFVVLMNLIVERYPSYQKFVSGYIQQYPNGKRNCFLPNTFADQSCVNYEVEDLRSELNDDSKFSSYMGIRSDVFASVKKNLFVECPICSMSEMSYSLETSVSILASIKNMYRAGSPQMIANVLCISFPQSSVCPITTQLINAFYSARTACSQCNMKIFDRGCLFDASCVCLNGFAGESCQTSCRGPPGRPCNLHGRCTKDGGCDCDQGYVGVECEIACRGVSQGLGICSGQGVCVTGKELAFQPGGNQFIQPPTIPWTTPTLTQLVRGDCACNAGFVGEDCSKACPGGAQLICNLRGLCSVPKFSSLIANATCGCSGSGLPGSGFFGDACEFVCPGTYLIGEAPPVGERGLNACFMHGVCDKSAAGRAQAYKNLKALQTSGLNLTNSTNSTTSNQGATSNILYTTCECFEGYKGAACNIECRGGYKSPCSRNGLCLEDGECDCNNGGTKDLGWRGRNCSIPCDGGPASICSLHGTCDLKGKCTCSPGFRAFDCSIECQGGAANVCSGKGVCDESGGCACSEGYRGAACEKVCPGLQEASICSGRGICDDDASCKCQALFEGENCENYAVWFFVVISFIFLIVTPLAFLGVKKMHRERVKHVRRLRRDKRKVRHSAAVAIRVKRYQRNDANQPPPEPADSLIVKPPSGEAQGVRRPIPRAQAVRVQPTSAVSDFDESEDDSRAPAIDSAVLMPAAPKGSPDKIVRRAKATIVAKDEDSDH